MAIQTANAETFRKIFMGGVRWLSFHKDILNDMNVYPVADGDTGTNMYLTLRGAVSSFKLAEDGSISALMKAISKGALFGARGNSGVILSQIIAGFARELKDKNELNVKDLAPAFLNAKNRAYISVSDPKEGTILTLIRVLSERLLLLDPDKNDLISFLEYICVESKKILNDSRDLLEALKENNVLDAGGQGFVYMLEGMLKAARYEEFKKISSEIHDNKNVIKNISEKIKNRYCVELSVKLTNYDFFALKPSLSLIGDSLVVANLEDILKVHIHTNNPEKIKRLCSDYGKIINEKCDDMKKQHIELIIERQNEFKEISFYTKVKTAILAVCAGEGFMDMFKSAGCFVIDGGPTMNPSINQIIEAISDIPENDIIILPNNPNCLLVCQQVCQISDKNIRILDTYDVSEGLMYLNHYDPLKNIDELVERFEKFKEEQLSVQISKATRDAVLSGKKVRCADWMAIARTGLIDNDRDFSLLIKKLSYLSKDKKHLTVIRGLDEVTDFEDDIYEYIRESFNIESDFIYGGQPNYPIILSLQ